MVQILLTPVKSFKEVLAEVGNLVSSHTLQGLAVFVILGLMVFSPFIRWSQPVDVSALFMAGFCGSIGLTTLASFAFSIRKIGWWITLSALSGIWLTLATVAPAADYSLSMIALSEWIIFISIGSMILAILYGMSLKITKEDEKEKKTE